MRWGIPVRESEKIIHFFSFSSKMMNQQTQRESLGKTRRRGVVSKILINFLLTCFSSLLFHYCFFKITTAHLTRFIYFFNNFWLPPVVNEKKNKNFVMKKFSLQEFLVSEVHSSLMRLIKENDFSFSLTIWLFFPLLFFVF